MIDWFRSWHGAPTDPKWLGIAKRAGIQPGIAVAIAWALMDRASQAAERGSIAGYDAEGLACFFGCEAGEVEGVIAAMAEKGMLERGRFVAWERRQPRREDDSTGRVRAHRERARAQRLVTPGNALERESERESDSESEQEREEGTTHAPDDAASAVDIYNSAAAAAGWPKVQRLTPQRRSAVGARLRDGGGIEGWRAAIARGRASAFLCGANRDGWKADFDFFCQAKSFTKLMEGSYDDRRPASGGAGGGRHTAAHDAIFRALADEAQKGAGPDRRPPGADGRADAERGGAGADPGFDIELAAGAGGRAG